MAILAKDVADKLSTVDDFRKVLRKTEPLDEVEFSEMKFEFEPEWSNNIRSLKPIDHIDAFAKVGGTEYQFTKDALLETASQVGVSERLARTLPTNLLTQTLNHFYKGLDKPLKLLTRGDNILALTRPTTTPFSNLDILNQVLAAVYTEYPGINAETELYVDYKYHHDLEQTAYRLIIPAETRDIRTDDPWSIGIQVTNSLVGKVQTSLRGYLFRWWCTNGAITVANSSSHWNRKSDGQDVEGMKQWVRDTSRSLIASFDEEFEVLADLEHTPLHRSIADTLRDIFDRSNLPARQRDAIVNVMVDSDDLTMYGVMQAITSVANTAGLSEAVRSRLMEVGGELPRANEHRCDSCHRIL